MVFLSVQLFTPLFFWLRATETRERGGGGGGRDSRPFGKQIIICFRINLHSSFFPLPHSRQLQMVRFASLNWPTSFNDNRKLISLSAHTSIDRKYIHFRSNFIYTLDFSLAEKKNVHEPPPNGRVNGISNSIKLFVITHFHFTSGEHHHHRDLVFELNLRAFGAIHARSGRLLSNNNLIIFHSIFSLF